MGDIQHKTIVITSEMVRAYSQYVLSCVQHDSVIKDIQDFLKEHYDSAICDKKSDIMIDVENSDEDSELQEIAYTAESKDIHDSLQSIKTFIESQNLLYKL